MSITHEALEGWVRANLATITEEIATIVGHESPSHDAQSLQSLAIKLDQRYRDADGSVRSLGTHLHITFGLGDEWLSQAKPALILGHFDTVWPIGALERMPVSIAANRMSGPGIFDMKTSLVMIPWALAAVKAKGLALTRRVEVLLTSDEEIGSPSSRDLIENLARESAYVLVLEPPLADGRLKTQRKGVGQFRVEITGQSAHAGIEPERGVSAIIELAEQVLQIQKMARPELGTTLNVGLIEGGTAPNVVAAHAWAVIDVRVSCSAEASRIEQEFCTLSSITPGTSLTVTGGFRRPPMERTPPEY